jgi:hypothetical protein
VVGPVTVVIRLSSLLYCTVFPPLLHEAFGVLFERDEKTEEHKDKRQETKGKWARPDTLMR